MLLILALYLNYIYNIKGNFFEANNKTVLDEVSMSIKEGTLTSAINDNYSFIAIG